MYINAYRCKAVGLSVNEVKCLAFTANESPDEQAMIQQFSLAIPRKLERHGLLVKTVDGLWQLTAAGQSKLNTCLPAA